MSSYNIFIETKVVRNLILNNFALYDKVSWVHSFSSRSFQSSPKTGQYAENGKNEPTLETPVAKPVHPSESVMVGKVV